MMCNKMYAALIMFFSAALTIASNQAFGETHLTFHPTVTLSLDHHGGRHTGAHHRGRHTRAHHRGRNIGTAVGGFFYGPANAEPEVVVTEPQLSGETPYTCSLDIPWDFVHRCPSPPEPASGPNIIPSVTPGCPAQHVTIPMGDGKEQTVTIVRCP
jgi:hypothetical protein